MATTLRYPYEIRDAKEYFDDIPDVKIEPDMLKLAEHILKSKATDFDPSQFVDRYEEAVVEMLKKKQAGLPVSREHRAAAAERREPDGRAPPQHCRGKANLPRKSGASASRDRARCCFPLRARRAGKPRQSQPSEQARVGRMWANPCGHFQDRQRRRSE